MRERCKGALHRGPSPALACAGGARALDSGRRAAGGACTPGADPGDPRWGEELGRGREDRTVQRQPQQADDTGSDASAGAPVDGGGAAAAGRGRARPDGPLVLELEVGGRVTAVGVRRWAQNCQPSGAAGRWPWPADGAAAQGRAAQQESVHWEPRTSIYDGAGGLLAEEAGGWLWRAGAGSGGAGGAGGAGGPGPAPHTVVRSTTPLVRHISFLARKGAPRAPRAASPEGSALSVAIALRQAARRLRSSDLSCSSELRSAAKTLFKQKCLACCQGEVQHGRAGHERLLFAPMCRVPVLHWLA